MRQFLIFLLGFGFSITAFAGDITKRSYSRYFEWESTDCYKPSAPYIVELDNWGLSEAETYAAEVNSYINCLEQEAQSDYDEARKRLIEAIEEGRDQAIENAQSEFDDFITELEAR